jgi:hypothetical protein
MRSRVAVLVAGLAAAPVSWPVHAAGLPQARSTPTVPDVTARTPGPAPTPTWDTFSADVTIRRQLLRRDGAVGLQAPEMRYRWTRTLGATGWKTTMTLVSASPDTIQTSKGPQPADRRIPVSRIEIGDPRTPTRVFDTEGRMVFMLPSSARPAPDGLAGKLRLGGAGSPTIAEALAAATTVPTGAGSTDLAAGWRSHDWVDQLMPTQAGRGLRRTALTRRFGAPSGLERGLERFVDTSDGQTTEILSDPGWAVPVEINVVRDGALVSHTTFAYVEDPGAGLVRRRMRSEHALSAESGERTVVDMELANIRLDRGGAR